MPKAQIHRNNLVQLTTALRKFATRTEGCKNWNMSWQSNSGPSGLKNPAWAWAWRAYESETSKFCKTQCRLLPKIARPLSQLIRHNGWSYIRWTKLTIAKTELRNQCLKLPNSCSTKTEEWPSPSKSCEGGVWSVVQAGSFRDEAEIISGLQRRCRVESAGDCLEPRWMDKGRCGQERLPGQIEPFRILSQRLRLCSSFLYGEAVHRTHRQSE